jgi:hypothetical protein
LSIIYGNSSQEPATVPYPKPDESSPQTHNLFLYAPTKCYSETYSKICTDKHISDASHIQNDLKQRDVISPLFFNFAIRTAQENKDRLELNGTHKLLTYADDANLSSKNMNSIKAQNLY